HRRYGFDAGQRLDLLQRAGKKRFELLRLRILFQRHQQVYGQQGFFVESQFGLLQAGKTFDEQARADQQHDGKRDFDDDQRTAHPPAACIRSGKAASVLEAFVDAALRKTQRGQESAQQGRQQRQAQRKHQHARVETHTGFGGKQVVGQQSQNQFQSPVR